MDVFHACPKTSPPNIFLSLYNFYLSRTIVWMELVWCSSSVMDYHTTARGEIPVGKGVKPSFTSFPRNSRWGVPSLNDLVGDGT